MNLLMNRYALSLAAVLLALAVGLGAFGAHALANLVDAKALANWHTAVQYHFIHALALMVLAIWQRLGAPSYVAKLSWGMLLGIVLFSGSLYAYVLTAWKPLVFFTPIGGSVWLITWLVLAWLSAKSLPVKHQVD
jgi:uncharacterized membrane protein YgdD (TMEM256/DUF423 family)